MKSREDILGRMCMNPGLLNLRRPANGNWVLTVAYSFYRTVFSVFDIAWKVLELRLLT